jgi:hypothetical protein
MVLIPSFYMYHPLFGVGFEWSTYGNPFGATLIIDDRFTIVE